jgi:predicted ATPase/DNA-binding winged helix-turn-helix (wHTH) protein
LANPDPRAPLLNRRAFGRVALGRVSQTESIDPGRPLTPGNLNGVMRLSGDASSTVQCEHMTLEHTSGDRYLFGPFELRAAERLLLRQGAPVALGSRAMDLLLCLLELEGEVVSPEELLDRVWRGVNVEPSALRVQVSALRKALREADPHGSYVSNLAGRGYCFAAPVLREVNVVPSAPTPMARTALPPELGRMVGRESVVGDLQRAIAAKRLVTVIGPGGIGKTTVALATAHRMSELFAGDVAVVDLASQHGVNVAGAVAAALRLTGVRDDAVADVAAQLRSRRLLLILDSCEHVIAGAAALAEALRESAPQVHILATSREPLNVPEEQVHRLAALETPPPSRGLSFEEVCAYPAAQLFVERVEASGGQIAHRPHEALVLGEICRKLDGIPLAIELAAGRVGSFGLATTLALLDSRLRLAWPGRRTAAPRHVTLSAALDWSYNLLSAQEAMLLRALSTFVGAFTLDAAEAVVDDAGRAGAQEALAGLVSKSLVATDARRSPVEYRLLDTTRDYARLKLEAAGEQPATAARHAAWILDALRSQEAQLDARPLLEWLDRFKSGIQEAQSALDWSLSANGDPSFAAPLTLACAPIWTRFGRAEVCRDRIEAALRVVEPNSRDEMALNIALVYALLDIDPQDIARAETCCTRALDLADDFNDPSANLRARWGLWNIHVGVAPQIPKAREDALRYREMATRHGGPSEKLTAERMVGVSELLAGDLIPARAAIDRALGLSPTWSVSARMASYGYDPDVMSRNTLLTLLWLDGMPGAAMAVALDNLDRAETTGSHATRAAVLADACGALALCVGDLAAADRYATMLVDCVEHGAASSYRTWAQVLRATVAAGRGDAAPGRSFVTETLPGECGHPRFAVILTELALRLGAAGAADVARDFADRLLQRFEASGERWIWSEVQRVRGELTEDTAAAEALFEAALAVAQQQGARAWALRAATSLARRRRSAAEDVLKPLLASFTEGAQTQDHLEARSVLQEYDLQ